MAIAKTMGRREILGVLGSFACGMTLAPAASKDDGHGSQTVKSSPFMDPVNGIHAHFCGIHIAKKNPKFQIVTQHYCSARSDDMHQCLLYDSCEANAKLLGIEYIITERVYRDLPNSERGDSRTARRSKRDRSADTGALCDWRGRRAQPNPDLGRSYRDGGAGFWQLDQRALPRGPRTNPQRSPVHSVLDHQSGDAGCVHLVTAWR